MENKLLVLVENIFSKENLDKDKYLVSKMDARSFVDLSVITKFPKVNALLPQHNSLHDNVNILRNALTQSRKLEIEDREKGSFVRPLKNDLATTILPVKKAAPQDPLVRAQAVWLLLTTKVEQPDEVAYSVEDILQHRVEASVSPSRVYQPKGAADATPSSLERALIAVLQPGKKKVATWSAVDGTTWADKSARRRLMLNDAKAKGAGYNKGMMGVHVCKGPEGPGFPRGRGNPRRGE
eukprot:TRINITY_DN6861_c1_g1_i1.p1 TRINITY_DN6861_c1_g1~~TRINITY_DN6861_c1_g1_i1.p1  ORF type:complete len:238 (+),score=46.41 TRINITY_DN6861_c1_g1_i1:157-870(+)